MVARREHDMKLSRLTEPPVRRGLAELVPDLVDESGHLALHDGFSSVRMSSDVMEMSLSASNQRRFVSVTRVVRGVVLHHPLLRHMSLSGRTDVGDGGGQNPPLKLQSSPQSATPFLELL